MTVIWKYFSLEQVNSKEGPDWKLWEQPVDYVSRGRNAFHAAEAARVQGEIVFDTFHFALLKARHEDKKDITDPAILIEVAKSVGLDIDRFRDDLNDRRLLNKLAEDHVFAVETLNVFGTPTLVFPEQQAVFLKMAPPPSRDESVTVFEDIRRLAEDRQQIKEIKRP
ncbi:MAG: DsbA family protein [Dehalococcoidales bacterium]|nr:MAG: DsbA family protein [Dehalococcoidales bacterium]